MKWAFYWKRLWKEITLSVLFLSIIGVVFYKIYAEPYFTKRNFDSIKFGMNMDEVKEIVGEPFALDTNQTYIQFRVNTNPLKSEMPVIYFDSLGKVNGKQWGEN